MRGNAVPIAGRILVTLAVATLVTAPAAPAIAEVLLPFSQTTGFKLSTGTEEFLGGAAPAFNAGGLAFTTPVTAPPGAPIGDNSAPSGIYQLVAWGCRFPAPIIASTCANGGTIGNGTTATSPLGNNDRSALQVLGQSGQLSDQVWKDITILNNQNRTVTGNMLKSVEIHSLLRLGAAGVVIDPVPPSIVTVNFKETPNKATTPECTAVPAPGAPVNPFGSLCDDFAVVNSLDLSSVFLPAGAVGNQDALFVDFKLDPREGALVCTGRPDQPAACGAYNGNAIIIYTDEAATHGLAVQGKLRPTDVGRPLPLFVIGNVEPHAVGDVVNFWGAQWWKNNSMSGVVSKGVASFKGYASNANDFCGGRWESRPGNSSDPPATIPDDVAIIVTDTVLKNGPNISGTIKQILLVHHDGGYGPNPGHRGNGPVTTVLCSLP